MYISDVPLTDHAAGKVLTANVLELLKLLPAFLAFVCSFVAATASIYVIKLQSKSAREIETFKSELVERLEAVKLRVGLSTRNFDQEDQFLIQARQAAVEYQTRLQELNSGIFDAAALREIERKMQTFAAALDSGSDIQTAYYEFLQEGINITDLARKKKARGPRQQIWERRGPILAAKLENLGPKIDEARKQARKRAEEEAFEKAIPSGGQSPQ